MVIPSVCCHLHLPPHNIKWVGGCLSDEPGASPKQEHDPHRQLPRCPPDRSAPSSVHLQQDHRIRIRLMHPCACEHECCLQIHQKDWMQYCIKQYRLKPNRCMQLRARTGTQLGRWRAHILYCCFRL